MSESNPSGSKDPLHGVTLKAIVTKLEAYYGWDVLGQEIRINCFLKDPSITSSLKFLRRTPWARAKVEQLYLNTDWDSPSPQAKAQQIWAKRR